MTILEAATRESAVTCCGMATTPVTEEDAARLAPMFKALGDPARVKLFSLIIAVGFGFIVGVLFTGWGRGK